MVTIALKTSRYNLACGYGDEGDVLCGSDSRSSDSEKDRRRSKIAKVESRLVIATGVVAPLQSDEIG